MKFYVLKGVSKLLIPLILLPYNTLLLPLKLPRPLANRIQAIENGLVPATEIQSRPLERRNLLEEMQAQHVPALSVAVIHNGKIEWAKGYGKANETGTLVTTKTLFQAASISKSLTAMAALHLVEQGKLSLDEPIQDELKSWLLSENSFTKQHPVTLRELLSHTSGISVQAYTGYSRNTALPTLQQILNGQKPANSEAVVVEAVPGTTFNYSGGNYSIVQQAITDAESAPFPKIMRDIILKPIGMRASTYKQPLSRALLSKAAMPTNGTGQYISEGPHTQPEMAAAGLWTTPSDLARWIIEVQKSLKGDGKRVLSTTMAKVMLTPIKENYALGVEIGGKQTARYFAHSGSNIGYNTYYVGYENGDGAVVLTNSNNGSVVIMELIRSIAHEYGWVDFKPVKRTLTPLPIQEQSLYSGSFRAKGLTDFEVKVVDDHLQLVVKDHFSYALLPSSHKLFFATDSELQVRFDSPDKGVLLFSQMKNSNSTSAGIPFYRITSE